mmetsp:Transcript_23001/g.71530  ORF Transcript_23001/g.71530 Transcript_23001/m.71530 type:complete len:293 (-) Transcript_23001:265-1143(-)|eukprot:CAMPEP_0118855468 /NCGR_PEP_ID=MMETSP1163-20130328/3284_1 /TAXON_ID=124430 /ORGANISM="Phaeomonas parva, Strain CCMP2877" /LENGTH=292 /DNA_ID=CAMNT_0006788359 /DNA_START=181 /DNA_END=1059 /DNA_ORIENTATION=+
MKARSALLLLGVVALQLSCGADDSLPWVISRRVKAVLERDLGYRPNEIAHMSPDVASIVVRNRLRRPKTGMPASWRRSNIEPTDVPSAPARAAAKAAKASKASPKPRARSAGGARPPVDVAWLPQLSMNSLPNPVKMMREAWETLAVVRRLQQVRSQFAARSRVKSILLAAASVAVACGAAYVGVVRLGLSVPSLGVAPIRASVSASAALLSSLKVQSERKGVPMPSYKDMEPTVDAIARRQSARKADTKDVEIIVEIGPERRRTIADAIDDVRFSMRESLESTSSAGAKSG